MPLILFLQHMEIEAQRLQQSSDGSFATPNMVYSDEVGDFGFVRIAEDSSMRVPLRQWEPVLATLLRALTVPVSQHLRRDSRMSRDLRYCAARQRPPAQMLEDVVDLSVHVHVMRMFGHAVKRGNHPKSDPNAQKSTTAFSHRIIKGDSDELETSLKKITGIQTHVKASQNQMHRHKVKYGKLR
jgi:hypothetical protein